MADEPNDATPKWAESILTGLSTLLSDMDSRLKKIEEQNARSTTKDEPDEPDEPKERKPKRSAGFLSAWDRE